jgi:hypothetical protein
MFVGCSGSVAGTAAPPATLSDASASRTGSSTTNAGEPLDATFADRISPLTGASDLPTDPGGPLDATFVDRVPSWNGRAPQSHIAAGPICPQQRGPGFVGCNPDGGVASPTALACLQDSDCTTGNNGRCTILPVSSPPPSGPGGQLVLLCGSSCSYDQCFSDTDCPVRVPCGCRSSGSDSAANVCLTGSDCAVDSDCGPGGFCSPSSSTQTAGKTLYFCHTANDVCLDDTDCPTGNGCQFDSVSSNWICVAPPPIR